MIPVFFPLKVTPVVPLSNDSWSMSFAKYLELHFYGHQYTRRANAEPCGHSIHKDYHQYFSYNQMVASFRLVLLFSRLTLNYSRECENCAPHPSSIRVQQILLFQLHICKTVRDLSSSSQDLYQEPGAFQSQPAAGPEGLLSEVNQKHTQCSYL